MENNNNIGMGFKRGSKSRPIITVANNKQSKIVLKELENNIKNGWTNLNLDVVPFIMCMKIEVMKMYRILERQKSNN